MRTNQTAALMTSLAVLMSVGLAGCASIRRPIDDFANLPPALPPSPTLDQVIQAVNGNCSQISTFSASQASISGPGFPTLQAIVVFERPLRLRVRAGTGILGEEIDLGSNDELFWFWARRGQPPAVFYCRHDQFASCPARQSLPVDPYWLVEALGVAEIDPTLSHQGPFARQDGRLEIRTSRPSPEGPSTKITVLDRTHALIFEQHIFDSRHQLIASAIAGQHRRDPLSGLSMPTVIDIRLPPQRAALRISLGNVQINRPILNAEQLWNIPAGDGRMTIDLCQAK